MLIRRARVQCRSLRGVGRRTWTSRCTLESKREQHCSGTMKSVKMEWKKKKRGKKIKRNLEHTPSQKHVQSTTQDHGYAVLQRRFPGLSRRYRTNLNNPTQKRMMKGESKKKLIIQALMGLAWCRKVWQTQGTCRLRTHQCGTSLSSTFQGEFPHFANQVKKREMHEYIRCAEIVVISSCDTSTTEKCNSLGEFNAREWLVNQRLKKKKCEKKYMRKIEAQ